MLFYSLIVGFSSSIDALGIGITYGIKNITITSSSNIILLLVSLFTTSISMLLGNVIKQILPINLTSALGSLILTALGIFMIFNTKSSDFDNSKNIEPKEALFLGFALSLDSFGIVIGSAVAGIYSVFLPIFISTLQIFFLKLGNLVGSKIRTQRKLSDNIWSMVSGILLIIIAFVSMGTG